MNKMHLVPGNVVQIKEDYELYWGEDEDGYEYEEGDLDCPDGWDYEMMKWCGKVVTISYVGTPTFATDFCIHIKEDDGRWSWRPCDFKWHMEEGDPNILFKVAQGRRRMEAMRKKWQSSKGK